MNQQRVFQVAKELGIANKDLVLKIKSMGIVVSNHMSVLEADDVLRVKRAIERDKQKDVHETWLGDTVFVRKRSKTEGVEGVAGEAVAAATPARAEAAVVATAASSSGAAEGEAGRSAARLAAEAMFQKVTKRVDDRAPDGAAGAAGAASAAAAARVEAAAAVAAAAARVEAAASAADTAAAARTAAESGLAGAEAAPAAEVVAAPAEPAGAEEDAATAAAKAEAKRVEAAPVIRPLEPGVPFDRPVTEGRREGPGAVRGGAPPAAGPRGPGDRIDRPIERQELRRPTMSQAVIVRKGPDPNLPAPAPVEPPNFAPGQSAGSSGGGGEGATPRTIEDIIRSRRDKKAAGGKRRTLTRREIFERQRERLYRAPKKKVKKGKKSRKTELTTPKASKRLIKVEESITAGELAKQMGAKLTDVLKKLIEGGTMATINHSLDIDTASVIAADFGYEVVSTAFTEDEILGQGEEGEGEDEEELEARPPVVTVMGHVDHGKTSLLDSIRETQVAAKEAGGITQHIGAYQVHTERGDITFIDTPGHHAFTEMRKRGAQVTDIVVLVVAANDGVMPQTIEAISHAKDADVPIIVAINKMDLKEANPDLVKSQLAEKGLNPEEWGGDTLMVPVSARSKMGLDELLEAIHLQAEILELYANPEKRAVGVVLEAKLDKGRGPVATILVLEGTLHTGDPCVAGRYSGKVRALVDHVGRNMEKAAPGTPVEVIGLKGVPLAGDPFNALATEREAEKIAEHRDQAARKREQSASAGSGPVTLETLKAHLEAGGAKELKIVLKADVQGSVEAVTRALSELSTHEVKVNVIRHGVGAISEDDVNLAAAGGAVIIGFNVRPAGKVATLAEKEKVDIRAYNIIYEAIDEVRKAMAGLLAPVEVEKTLGRAEVRQVFNIPKFGAIAGSFVTDGKVRRSALCRLLRDGVQIYQSKISSLRRFKDDVREVEKGFECGLAIENFNDVKPGDIVEIYEIERIAPTLAPKQEPAPAARQ
ncbi:MAG TPA: translation initiation factor IF-2 [Myxococcota bacterium]|jgi:translation initiation factor IF-2|nr:translation initiation factor IF-2 [Myxococcota bacterium]